MSAGDLLPSPFDSAPTASGPLQALSPAGSASKASPAASPASGAMRGAASGLAGAGATSRGMRAAESGLAGAAPLGSCLIGSAPQMSVRYTSGGMAIMNSCPIPTLLPPGGEGGPGARPALHCACRARWLAAPTRLRRAHGLKPLPSGGAGCRSCGATAGASAAWIALQA